ncbi:pitrilysin family protein [Acaryochloris sp. CCMEE 5410]|uniref:M16 family metallopeptidase n=1 Tax=Acaryochloris sp. CCMEE 5410 TaxID=310037 RepID=UPI000248433D|nr:pitrilysin family protein [Acaryochloris sp. CCMEE 5410]KAI9133112.1 insulinase family protein [Acaryochloris sp. CCMEE 5410]
MWFHHNPFESQDSAQAIGAAQAYPVNQTRLENGLTVVHQYIPLVPVVAVDIWVKAGVTSEPESVPGLAHVLEHMIFKGTETVAPQYLDRLLERQGGIVNAATGYDYAHFYIVTLADQLEACFAPFVNLLIHATIPEAEFRQEQDIICAEIDQAYDNPDWVVYQSARQLLFSHHPYGRPVLGFDELPPLLSAAHTRDFHHRLYQPDNMTIVLVGDLTHEQAIDLVQKHCDWPQALLGRKPPPLSPLIPLSQRSCHAMETPGIDQARLTMAWLGPDVSASAQGYGLDLLSVLLTGGRTSQLVADLLEQRGWAYDIHSEFFLQREGGCFTISVWLDPQYLEGVETVIREYLYQLGESCISETELHRCQQLVVNDFTFGTEMVNQLAGLYGYYSILGELEQALAYPQLIQALEPQHLQNLVQQYLSPNNYAITTLQPCSL